MNAGDIEFARDLINNFNCDVYQEYISPFNPETHIIDYDIIWIDENVFLPEEFTKTVLASLMK